MLNKIKKEVEANINKMVEIVYNGSRNKIEVYKGVIIEVYNSIFVVRLNNGLTKSFLYADLLIGVISIKY